jgi:DNA invertase Pin-like site-specific DNA recombinase
VVIPAVGYLRCSTDGQVDASIPAQKTAVGKWADEHGYTILRWYVDAAASGWKQEREAFQRLIADMDRRHDFRAVLAWDQNRFSRFPPLEACHYWYLLDRAGVHLATCNQGRVEWNSIAGFLTATIKQHADAQHRFQLSADVKRGKRAAAERGLWQTRIPYAYQLGADRRLTLGDPAEAAVVRRVFRECVEGRSLRGICGRLNADGIPSPRGGLWAASVLVKILRNPAYIGTYRHRDVELPGHHPAIVDVDTFNRIGRLLDERQTNTTPHQGGGGFLFSGLLRCGKCGSPMGGHRHSGRTGDHRYVCSGAKQYGKARCDSNAINQKELLVAVVDAVVGWASDPAVVSVFREEARRLVQEQTTAADPDKLRAQLATTEAKLAKAKKRLCEVDTDLLPVVQVQLRELLAERDRLQTALKAAQTPAQRIVAEQDELIEEAFRVFLGLREAIVDADPEQAREMIRSTVEHIDVFAERDGRGYFHLCRGNIALRGDNLSPKPGLRCSTPSA